MFEEGFDEGGAGIGSGGVEAFVVVDLAGGVEVVEAELEGDLLIGARAGPDGDGEGDGLEVEEAGFAAVFGELAGGGFLVEVGFAAEGAFADALVDEVELVGGDFAHVVVAGGFQFFDAGGAEAIEGGEGVVGGFFLGDAVIAEATGEGVLALGAGGDVGFFGLRGDGLCFFEPAGDFLGAGNDFVGEVDFGEEALVVAVAGVDEGVVDVGEGDFAKGDSGLLGDEGLHRDVVVVVVFDGGGGFDFDQVPFGPALVVLGKQDVGEDEAAGDAEGGFEEGSFFFG